ncbi:hypothetical protein SKAU_G00168200 [Synaphobranchus kaupii]|uniref:DH domain-containing protein n=1 Tax=Synaphobranchus kaupii TaxID=118154 RepID=A0A9Q1FJV3_SYNKA|nr:hypothetical protein SKAU_G00168200 [Synaphobranchus kaupii]
MENSNLEEQYKEMDEVNLQIAQLQALTAELRNGLVAVMEDLSTLKQRDNNLEETMRDHQEGHGEKDPWTYKTPSTPSRYYPYPVGRRGSQRRFVADQRGEHHHREIQQGLERVQVEVGSDQLSTSQRKGSKEDFSSDGHACASGETELSIVQHYFASLNNSSPQRSFVSTQSQEGNKPKDWASATERACDSYVTEQAGGEEALNATNSEKEFGQQEQQQQTGGADSPMWRSIDRMRGADTPENSKRQTAALELLESERVYVSYLSLLLKANITFNGSEAIHLKDKRVFPSSLRFLIQQHLELLHILQERVLKCQWQGILGDVFMRLTSKESDFLHYYVAYLKELPECLSAGSVYSAVSMKSAGLFEGDVMRKETHPPLHVLLCQPVQRIPEYLMLLQNMMRQTDCEHPDYYLLLICTLQIRAFTEQYSHLLQYNKELLLQNSKELKRQQVSQMKRRKQRHLEQHPAPDSTLDDGLSIFLLPREVSGLGGLYKDCDSLHDVGLFDKCSSASSDSSADIVYRGGTSHNSGCRLPVRGCVLSDEAGMMHHRPLQAVQCKSKSLNGLQLDSTVNVDTSPTKGLRPAAGHTHHRLERQPSKGSTNHKLQRSISPTHKLEDDSRTATEEELRRDNDTDCTTGLVWEAQPRWSGVPENSHTPFNQRSRKQDQKGGFRSSFKKLFKKKSGVDGKDKDNDKSEVYSDYESMASPGVTQLGDIDRGTAV